MGRNTQTYIAELLTAVGALSCAAGLVFVEQGVRPFVALALFVAVGAFVLLRMQRTRTRRALDQESIGPRDDDNVPSIITQAAKSGTRPSHPSVSKVAT